MYMLQHMVACLCINCSFVTLDETDICFDKYTVASLMAGKMDSDCLLNLWFEDLQSFRSA